MPATPFSISRPRVLTALLAALLASGALAQSAGAQTTSQPAAPSLAQAATPAPDAPLAPSKAKSPVVNSALDAPMFYQLLIGEIELREGDAGTAYQVMLDAARRTKDEQLFRRATEIALQRAPAIRRSTLRKPGARRCRSRSKRIVTRSSCSSR